MRAAQDEGGCEGTVEGTRTVKGTYYRAATAHLQRQSCNALTLPHHGHQFYPAQLADCESKHPITHEESGRAACLHLLCPTESLCQTGDRRPDRRPGRKQAH